MGNTTTKYQIGKKINLLPYKLRERKEIIKIRKEILIPKMMIRKNKINYRKNRKCKDINRTQCISLGKWSLI